MKQQKKSSRDITIGLDLGDRRHRFCVLDKWGGLLEEGSVRNERVFLAQLSERYPGALAVVEAGCHSPWISRYLQEQGCRVLIANPRKLRAIYQHERKSDQRDAQMLARIGRLDPALLYPVRHGTAEAQQDLLRIKLRDSLVRARVAVINSVRFTLKSLGYTVRNPSSERFHKVAMEGLPVALCQMIAPSLQALEELTARIKAARGRDQFSGTKKVSSRDPAPANSRRGPHHRALFCFEDRGPDPLPKTCATSAPTRAHVQNAIKAGRAIHNCASPNVATPTCVDCSLARPSTSSVPSVRRALCALMA